MSGSIAANVFPNVPDLPGVPALLRQVGANLPLPVTEFADAIGLGSLFAAKWGLFLSGTLTAALVCDSVIGIEFAADSRVSDYPVEGGAFASYNKVQAPFQCKITFAISGVFSFNNVVSAFSAVSPSGAVGMLTGESARTTFLAACEAARLSTDIYSVVTPSFTYPSVTVMHYDYRRTAKNGATLLMVDVWVEEVRQAATPQFVATAKPSGADPVPAGTVQGTAPVVPGNSAPVPDLTPKAT